MASRQGTLIKNWRREAGMSRAELGKAVNLEKNTIASIEKGTRPIALPNMQRFIDALELSESQAHALREAHAQDEADGVSLALVQELLHSLTGR